MNQTRTDLATLRARDLMSTALIIAAPEESLRTAATRMAGHRVHCLLVTHRDSGRAPGIIAGKDIVQTLAAGDASVLDELQVADAMTSPAVTVSADFAIVDCINLMRLAGIRAVFVTENDEPVGLLSFTDVLRAVSDEA